jgi:HPt (histidine-containing phosphotransfer) domain-containing protein
LDELASELDRDFAVEICGMYIQDTPEQIEVIAAALEKKDSAALTQSAHKLKGSSLNIGAAYFGSICLQLEQMGKSGMPLQETGAIQELKTEFEVVRGVLQEYINKV